MVRVLLLFIALIAALAVGGPAWADSSEAVLHRIARTGVLVAATRDDAPPFAFRDAQGHLAGLSVDIIEAIRQALSRKFGHEIRLEPVIVTPPTRIKVIEDHQADLDCETATVTWTRAQQVDFTLPIFRDGARILTYRDTIARVDDLQTLRIGIAASGVEGEILRDKWPGVALTTFPSMTTALQGLETGKVDGIANIGLALRGLLPLAAKRQGLVIVPRGDALGYETIACLVPQNDSRWHDFVNGVLRDLLQGIDQYRGGYVEIYEHWFGRDADISYPMDERTVQFFLSQLIWLN